jgi:hypothetical protein
VGRRTKRRRRGYDHPDYTSLKSAVLDFLRLSPDARRALVEEYSAKYCFPRMDQEKASGMYVFLRVLFDLPSKHPIEDAKIFGGWMRFSAGDSGQDYFNLSWPVEIAGEPPTLTVKRFDGYSGKGYDCIGEYDYFLERFKLRSRRALENLVVPQ